MILQKSERIALSVVLLVFSLATSAQAEQDDAFAKMAMECKTAGMEEVTIEDIMRISAPTDESKCFLACTMKKMGLLTEDGELNIDAALALRHKMDGVKSDVEKDQLFSDALTSNCAALKGDNDCDTAFRMFKCGKLQHDAVYM